MSFSGDIIIARDLGAKKILIGGLGKDGKSLAWFTELESHMDKANYANALIVVLTNPKTPMLGSTPPINYRACLNFLDKRK
jgi:hypothetical protein